MFVVFCRKDLSVFHRCVVFFLRGGPLVANKDTCRGVCQAASRARAVREGRGIWGGRGGARLRQEMTTYVLPACVGICVQTKNEGGICLYKNLSLSLSLQRGVVSFGTKLRVGKKKKNDAKGEKSRSTVLFERATRPRDGKGGGRGAHTHTHTHAHTHTHKGRQNREGAWQGRRTACWQRAIRSPHTRPDQSLKLPRAGGAKRRVVVWCGGVGLRGRKGGLLCLNCLSQIGLEWVGKPRMGWERGGGCCCLLIVRGVFCGEKRGGIIVCSKKGKKKDRTSTDGRGGARGAHPPSENQARVASYLHTRGAPRASVSLPFAPPPHSPANPLCAKTEKRGGGEKERKNSLGGGGRGEARGAGWCVLRSPN